MITRPRELGGGELPLLGGGQDGVSRLDRLGALRTDLAHRIWLSARRSFGQLWQRRCVERDARCRRLLRLLRLRLRRWPSPDPGQH
eukprot:6713073-Prymnesium_polylepis.2